MLRMLISDSPTRAIPEMNFPARSNVSGGAGPTALAGSGAPR